jgi:hypothetical protein
MIGVQMHFPSVALSERFLCRALALACGLLLAGCGGGGGGGGSSPTQTPTGQAQILQMDPTEGPPGTRIELHGTGLANITQVTMGGKDALHISHSDTKLVVWVPTGAVTATIQVETSQGTISSPAPFTVDAAAPALWTFSPSSGAVHSSVTLYGSNLNTIKHVTIGGAEAPFKVASENRIQATVPSGAVSGKVAVASDTAKAEATGLFTVHSGPAPDPELNVLEPPKGPVGTKVVLTGAGLASVQSVAFAGATATPGSWTSARCRRCASP